MDFLTIGQVADFIKIDPSHGILQSVLLFMIWWSSKDLKKELVKVQIGLNDHMSKDENRFQRLENVIK